MNELCPYFTNDGTVGLFSKEDDDIYHSTYGAVTESWQKFIIPAKLKEYVSTHESIKILDLCYGIGYNSKAALNVFVENFLKSKVKIDKNSYNNSNNYATIYSDNILNNELGTNKKNIHENLVKDTINNDAIYVDNINGIKNDIHSSKEKYLLVDAVDLDKILINISPFITRGRRCNFLLKKYQVNKYDKDLSGKNKLSQIKKINNNKTKTLSSKFKIKKEVLMILLESLLEKNPDIKNDKFLPTILSQKKFTPFFDKFMFDFAIFCHKKTFKHYPKTNKLTFLHNIYYRHVSKSYKNVQKIIKKNKIDINIHNMDARRFVQKTNMKYNFIFLDAFTPAKCPALWSIQFFDKLYELLEADGVILTYSSSAAVRNALLQNGFCIGKTFDSSINKFVGTIASKNPEFIKYPLEQKDIDLINSKAGICYSDVDLNLDNDIIIRNREREVENSDLLSSSKVLKEHKGDNVKAI